MVLFSVATLIDDVSKCNAAPIDENVLILFSAAYFRSETLCSTVSMASASASGLPERMSGTVSDETITGIISMSISGLIERALSAATSAFFLPIKQVAQAHFGIGDIDKQIAMGNLYDIYLEETKTGFGDVMDKYIAGKATEDNVEKYAPATAVSASNVLDYLDYCKVWLKQNDVKSSTEISVVGSPAFGDLVRKAYVNKGYDRATEHLQNGEITRYNNMIIKESNNVYTANESGTDYEYIQVKTNKAIAFVKPLLKLEPYRNHPLHRDDLAAFVYYDAAVVRPKEIIVLKVKYS